MISEAKGVLRPNALYIIVQISPPIRTTFWDGPETDFDRVILAPEGAEQIELADAHPLFVDVVLCPSHEGDTVDERQCSKLGTALVHLADPQG